MGVERRSPRPRRSRCPVQPPCREPSQASAVSGRQVGPAPSWTQAQVGQCSASGSSRMGMEGPRLGEQAVEGLGFLVCARCRRRDGLHAGCRLCRGWSGRLGPWLGWRGGASSACGGRDEAAGGARCRLGGGGWLGGRGVRWWCGGVGRQWGLGRPGDGGPTPVIARLGQGEGQEEQVHPVGVVAGRLDADRARFACDIPDREGPARALVAYSQVGHRVGGLPILGHFEPGLLPQLRVLLRRQSHALLGQGRARRRRERQDQATQPSRGHHYADLLPLDQCSPSSSGMGSPGAVMAWAASARRTCSPSAGGSQGSTPPRTKRTK